MCIQYLAYLDTVAQTHNAPFQPFIQYVSCMDSRAVFIVCATGAFQHLLICPVE